MTRAATPLWTARPSRYAGAPRPAAWAALATLAVLLVAAGAAPGAETAGDTGAYAGAVEAMRHDGDFYPVLAEAFRGDAPIGAFSLAPPTLAAVASRVPGWALSAMLFALAGAVAAAWWPRLDAALARPGARIGAALLIVAGALPYLRPSMPYVPEVWAGLFVALSLGLRARDRWVEAAAFGLAAGAVREAAGVYLLVMAAFALASGARREAAGWGVALAVLAGVAAAHGRAVAREIGPLDGEAYFRVPDIAGAVRSVVEASPFAAAPLPIAAPVLVLAAFGWTAWAAGAGARVAAAIGCLALVAVVAPGADANWGYLAAALLPAGLAFAPDGVRDLGRAAIGGRRRRITVTRVVR